MSPLSGAACPALPRPAEHHTGRKQQPDKTKVSPSLQSQVGKFVFVFVTSDFSRLLADCGGQAQLGSLAITSSALRVLTEPADPAIHWWLSVVTLKTKEAKRR